LARKILLADDSVTAQNMGRKILADAGYEVFTVNNGSAALKKIAEAKPELIVLDVYMPGYSGLEVCQRLKETQETSRIPILLTVGKLEPFKPEEAKRVRADAFIVKPFEASELLSALSKLEDKIVPAGRESSKPGRFARANAAIDEGRYDKTMAIEEDSGWKNRIAFPSKKKKATEEEDGNDPAIYNAVNKDLRTVIERPAAPTQEAPEERVNVEALAPEGLPKDVTPEEIAALAAAAAQIQGTVAENKEAEPVPAPPAAAETLGTPKSPINQADIETIDLNLAAIRQAEAALAERQSQAAPAPPQQPEVAKEPEATASMAEVPVEPKKEAEKPADVPAVPQNTTVSPEDGLGSQDAADVPITMAAAVGAEHAVIPSRWAAVSIPLSSDEAALSLEHEMQKAHAAFAAAETHSAAVVIAPEPSTPESPAPEPLSAPEPTAEKTTSEPEPAQVAPEVSEAATAIASMTTDAISAAVKELEAVAASYEGHRPFPSETESSVLASEAAASPKEAEPEPPIPASLVPAEPARSEPEPVSQQQTEAPVAETKTAETKTEEAPAAIQEVTSTEQPTLSPVEPSQAEASPSLIETAVPSHDAEPVQSAESSAGGTTGMSKKESEIAESTAAAWASWRRVRESGDHHSASSSNDDNDHADAAMAVAAGAEKAPEDATSIQESGEIASIVDSVLADLRPKIVEEISRKLGKKK
jgi:CheY-like chemotaxis protein